MIAFLILATVLVAGALLLVLPPLFGTGARARAHAARQEQARTALIVLREQVAELEAERAAGRVPDTEYQRSREELEQRALTEGGVVEAGADNRPARGWAAAVIVAVPTVAVAIYLVLGSPDGLDPELAKPQQAAGHQVTPEQMAAMVKQLSERLVREPNDPQGWLMLGRSYAVMQDLRGAAETWSKIGSKIPEEADVLADWADLLASGAGRKFDGDPDQLIARALKLDPNHFKALALAGTSAFQRGDYASASTLWERILQKMDPSEGVYGAILGSINEARTKGGLPLLNPPGAAQVAAMPGAAAGQQAQAAALTVRGRVSLAPELAAQAGADETVFLFARPMQGGMPLAAMRFRVGDLPAEFDFANAQRMSQGPLPTQIGIGARVSKQGSATASAGDLESAPVLVSPDASGVTVVIDRVRK
ncbi:c-type cytochrome biogenesis protein CcmI [Azoarcus sp. KH32C]|uniref:c-type cytochrome biogenesis protein CcmI n=1 Tax=Azoarcus sp. KH32C TaxID=748247 RepID=UPI00023868EE|nr:c-type cytochrome biogenesis protein CcmI [Azoarcus sp. KH32C]BAL22664.1 putative cyctochrome C biogenesis protein [Azoarcus sp. KH32C]